MKIFLSVAGVLAESLVWLLLALGVGFFVKVIANTLI